MTMIQTTTNEELVISYQNGEKSALDALMTNNMGLIHKVAKKWEGQGLDHMDLFQEGAMGLMVAANKFDPTMGYKFTTYAHAWIKQAISRAVANKGRAVRIPVNVFEEHAKIVKAEKELSVELGRTPSSEEVGAKINMSAARVNYVKKSAANPSSLDKYVGKDKDTTVGELLEDTMFETPENRVENKDLTEKLIKVLSTLNEKERKVIILRYGIGTNVPKTLQEIGNMMGVSRERIRQIEAKALGKLRNPARANMVKDYVVMA